VGLTEMLTVGLTAAVTVKLWLALAVPPFPSLTVTWTVWLPVARLAVEMVQAELVADLA